MEEQKVRELNGSDIDKLGKLLDTEQGLSFKHFALKVGREQEKFPPYTVLMGAMISAGYDDWELFCAEQSLVMSEINARLIVPFMEANPDFLLNLPSKTQAAPE